MKNDPQTWGMASLYRWQLCSRDELINYREFVRPFVPYDNAKWSYCFWAMCRELRRYDRGGKKYRMHEVLRVWYTYSQGYVNPRVSVATWGKRLQKQVAASKDSVYELAWERAWLSRNMEMLTDPRLALVVRYIELLPDPRKVSQDILGRMIENSFIPDARRKRVALKWLQTLVNIGVMRVGPTGLRYFVK